MLQNANEMTETIMRRRENSHSVFECSLLLWSSDVGTLSSPSVGYVVPDEAVWMVATPLKAVDRPVCFKAFHASYPAETLFWQLLQNYMYNNDTKCDVKSVSLNALLSELREI